MIEPFVVESVSAARMADLAKVLDDPNPIHLDAQVVQALGMGEREINQGPANCSYVVNLLRAAFPDAVIRHLSFRLLGNVFAGERVVAGGTIDRQDGDTTYCTVWLEAGDRGHIVEGTATLVIQPTIR
jgi:3-hydroxybutyryl-CoA dehydratase